MSYILEKVLTVRDHRENKKLNHLVKTKEAVKKALETHRQKEQELNEYKQWRRLEEGRQLNDLKQKSANINDVLYYTDTLNTLRQDQTAKSQKVQKALTQVSQAEKEMASARQEYNQACKKKMKIVEHKNIWLEEHRRHTELQDENELEESSQQRPCAHLHHLL